MPLPFWGMNLTDLAGTTYGPVSATISAAKVAEYVHATGDATDRWLEYAPPSYAGALLFVIAPRFLWDPDIREYTKLLLHSTQEFRWHGPLLIGATVTIDAEITSIRERGSMHFVTFRALVTGEKGPLVDSRSTFLMAADGVGDRRLDEGEPDVDDSELSEIVGRVRHGGTGSVLPVLAKSASRADLIRYAGASGDFNPIHYDHETARSAGFGGVIVHGLLMGAWAAQLASATSERSDPLSDLQLRFRNVLRPGVGVLVTGSVGESSDAASIISLRITGGDTEYVSGRAAVRDG